MKRQSYFQLFTAVFVIRCHLVLGRALYDGYDEDSWWTSTPTECTVCLQSVGSTYFYYLNILVRGCADNEIHDFNEVPSGISFFYRTICKNYHPKEYQETYNILSQKGSDILQAFAKCFEKNFTKEEIQSLESFNRAFEEGRKKCKDTDFLQEKFQHFVALVSNYQTAAKDQASNKNLTNASENVPQFESTDSSFQDESNPSISNTKQDNNPAVESKTDESSKPLEIEQASSNIESTTAFVVTPDATPTNIPQESPTSNPSVLPNTLESDITESQITDSSLIKESSDSATVSLPAKQESTESEQTIESQNEKIPQTTAPLADILENVSQFQQTDSGLESNPLFSNIQHDDNEVDESKTQESSTPLKIESTTTSAVTPDATPNDILQQFPTSTSKALPNTLKSDKIDRIETSQMPQPSPQSNKPTSEPSKSPDIPSSPQYTSQPDANISKTQIIDSSSAKEFSDSTAEPPLAQKQEPIASEQIIPDPKKQPELQNEKTQQIAKPQAIKNDNTEGM